MPANRAQELMKAVNAAMKEEVLHMASNGKYVVEYLPTGLLPIDILLQGGLPRGRFVEIYGSESTLKSYIGLSAIRETQRAGGVAAVIDTEHAFDEEWARNTGVNVDDLIIQRPPTGELAMDTCDVLIRGGADLIVFDSIAATLPQSDSEKRLHGNNANVARLASLMSLALRKLTTANSRTAMLWINQTRLNVGVMFGNPETTTGGKSMAFYASMRARMSRIENIKEDVKVYDGEKNRTAKVTTGQMFKAELVKSKLSIPFRDVYFAWDLNGGKINIPRFLRATGSELEVVTRRGNSWSFGGQTGTSQKNFEKMIASDPVYAAELENAIREKSGLPLITVPKVSVRRTLKRRGK